MDLPVRATTFNNSVVLRSSAKSLDSSEQDPSQRVEKEMSSVFELHTMKSFTKRDTKNIVTGLIKDIFQDMRGTAKPSDSECSLDAGLRESLSMDPRLQLWYDTLRDRAAVQARIARRIGRRPDEMLINLPTTVAPRDRGNMERLLDMAGRMNPTTLARKEPAFLPAISAGEQQCQCQCLPALQETLPRAEQRGKAQMTVSGLTQATKYEIMGRTPHPPENPAQWLQSKVLDKRIEQQDSDIQRVLQFYPDVDGLEVLGAGMQEKLNTSSSYRLIERVPADSMHSISDTTPYSSEEELEEQEEAEDTQTVQNVNRESDFELPPCAIKVNGVLYFNTGRRCAIPEVANVQFECHPYQIDVRDVLCVENVGRTIVTCQWSFPDTCRPGSKCQALQRELFVMSRSMFTVFPGEKRVCRALFRPHMCVLFKQRLLLRTFPDVLGSARTYFVARLSGRCIPAPEFTAKLRRLKNTVTDKSKKRYADGLTQHQASLVPLLQPHEVICPYERVFDERELFNAQNEGYRCERFDDLEALKRLHHELKKPRERDWDLRLQTVVDLILRLPEASQRSLHFARFLEIKESMKRGDCSEPVRFGRTEERDRSRFIYVRGCIGTGIEEWEEMMISLELNALKTEMTRFQARQQYKEQGGGGDGDGDSEPKPWMRQLRQDNEQLYMLKRLRSRKPYRDSLYMTTYSHLCDLAEDVVSIIESTQYV